MKRGYQETGFGWWKESEIAETIRTPVGGGGMMANVIVYDLPEDNGMPVPGSAPGELQRAGCAERDARD